MVSGIPIKHLEFANKYMFFYYELNYHNQKIQRTLTTSEPSVHIAHKWRQIN